MLERHATQRVTAQSKDVADVGSLKTERAKLAQKKAFTLDEYADIGPDLLRTRIEPMTAKLSDLDRRIAIAEQSSDVSDYKSVDAIKNVLRNMKKINALLGESSPASVRAALNVMSRIEADPESGECDVEVRIPEEAWLKKFDGREMCDLATPTTKNCRSTHQSNALILAKFRCQKGMDKNRRCVTCTRTAA